MMKKALRLTLALLFCAQQALASPPVYYVPAKVSPVDFQVYPMEFFGQKPSQIGETTIIVFDTEAYETVYVGEAQTESGPIPKFDFVRFLGHTDNPKDAAELLVPKINPDDLLPHPPEKLPVPEQPLASPLDVFADHALDLGLRGVENGAIAGVSVAISAGLINTEEVQKYYNDRKIEFNQSRQEVSESQARSKQSAQTAYGNFSKFAEDLKNAVNNSAAQGTPREVAAGRDIKFKSQDPKFTSELRSTVEVLDSSPRKTQVQRTAQDMGYAFVAEADSAFASGNYEDAAAFQRYALAAADIAVGWDPVTGVVRSTYEAFTGFNMITGERLTLTEQSFAALGVVTLGYGNKIGQGLRALQKFAAKKNLTGRLLKALDRAENLVKNNFVTRNFTSKKLDQYYEQLRQLDQDAYNDLRNYFEANPDKKEKYLSLLKEREGVEVKYWTDAGEVIPYRQERSARALEELELALEPHTVLVRHGGDDWSLKQKLEHIAKTGEPPGFSSRVNIEAGDPKTAPVNWMRYHDGIGAESLSQKFGMYSNGDAFAEYARIKPGATVITKTAASGFAINPLTGVGTRTAGGGIEIIVSPGGAETFKFAMKK